MRKYLTCWELISSLVIGLASVVEIHKDITVKPTPDRLLSPADSVDVTMYCTGSRYDIRYYIKNKMRWTFVPNSGKQLMLTDSFFLTEDATNSLNYPNERLSLSYQEDIKGFKFAINIRGVTRADNGIYRCSLVDRNGKVIDSKNVTLTVVNPVQSMQIELYDAHNILISASSASVSQNSQPIKISPGQYMVKCKAHGSNPEPVMDLYLNDQNLHISTKSREDKSSEFKSLNGSLKIQSLAIDEQTASQALVCKANIPGDFYQFREAGIYMMVEKTTPNFACEDTCEDVSNRYIKLRCNVSDDGNKDSLVCDNTSWLLGNRGQLIKYEENWKDKRKEYYILEFNCVKTNLGLNVMLDIYKVNNKSLQERFFIVYRNGENVYIHPVELRDIATAEANVLPFLSVLCYLALAGISKQLSV